MENLFSGAGTGAGAGAGARAGARAGAGAGAGAGARAGAERRPKQAGSYALPGYVFLTDFPLQKFYYMSHTQAYSFSVLHYTCFILCIVVDQIRILIDIFT